MLRRPDKQHLLKLKKRFLQALNNSNFGIDCRNNIDNCYLEPIYDDFSEIEIGYIKNYTTIFSDEELRDFFSPPLLRQEINQTYEAKIFNVNKEDPTYKARKKYLERKKEEDLDAVSTFENSKKIKKKKVKNY